MYCLIFVFHKKERWFRYWDMLSAETVQLGREIRINPLVRGSS